MATSTTTTTSGPTGFQLDAFRNLAQRAEQLYQSPFPQYYPGRTYTPFSQQTDDALRVMESFARGGSAQIDAAQQANLQTLRGDFLNNNPAAQYATSTARGDFLGPNPYADKIYGRMAGGIRDNVNSAFLQGGRFGSTSNTRALADSLGDAANQFYGENYARERQNQLSAQSMLSNAFQNERANQQRAGLMAPQMEQARYLPWQQLAQVGSQREAMDQTALQADIDRHNFNQNLPAMKLQQFGNFVSGAPGGTISTQSQPIYRNNVAGFLGGALGGAQLGGSLGFGGGANALFAGAGGLLGLLA